MIDWLTDSPIIKDIWGLCINPESLVSKIKISLIGDLPRVYWGMTCYMILIIEPSFNKYMHVLMCCMPNYTIDNICNYCTFVYNLQFKCVCIDFAFEFKPKYISDWPKPMTKDSKWPSSLFIVYVNLFCRYVT